MTKLTAAKGKVLPDLSQMQELLERLMAENAALKAKGTTDKGVVTCSKSTYVDNKGKSHDMVAFEGGGIKPFSLSYNKCKHVIANLAAVKAIVGIPASREAGGK